MESVTGQPSKVAAPPVINRQRKKTTARFAIGGGTSTAPLGCREPMGFGVQPFPLFEVSKWGPQQCHPRVRIKSGDMDLNPHDNAHLLSLAKGSTASELWRQIIWLTLAQNALFSDCQRLLKQLMSRHPDMGWLSSCWCCECKLRREARSPLPPVSRNTSKGHQSRLSVARGVKCHFNEALRYLIKCFVVWVVTSKNTLIGYWYWAHAGEPTERDIRGGWGNLISIRPGFLLLPRSVTDARLFPDKRAGIYSCHGYLFTLPHGHSCVSSLIVLGEI